MTMGMEASAPALVLHGSVHKVGPAAHKGVGQISALEDGCGAEELVDINDRLGLGRSVHIESAVGKAEAMGGLQQGAKRNNRHVCPSFA